MLVRDHLNGVKRRLVKQCIKSIITDMCMLLNHKMVCCFIGNKYILCRALHPHSDVIANGKHNLLFKHYLTINADARQRSVKVLVLW